MIFCFTAAIIVLPRKKSVHVLAGGLCQYDDSISSYYKSRYCTYGCCGNKDSDYSDVCFNRIHCWVCFGFFTGLCILIVIPRCCCAGINYSSRQTETVIQPSKTAMQTFVVNPAAVSQGQTVSPAQQKAVGYALPSAGLPPQYVQHQNVSEKTADLTCHSPQEAKY
ncbi:hypothetical protein ACJMK2_000421 [Sinanodonta woodiana]|uniref:Vesicular, overexpressed in cancer, prosurvival protein 1 n=1 Tax=Sinanodonta woodiana TaxID=1069815 RepID=A0ABD3XSN5_SINWO